MARSRAWRLRRGWPLRRVSPSHWWFTASTCSATRCAMSSIHVSEAADRANPTPPLLLIPPSDGRSAPTPRRRSLMPSLPKYADLPVIEKTGEHHSWNVWGKDDQLGMMNLLTSERVLRAASLVKKGKVFN